MPTNLGLSKPASPFFNEFTGATPSLTTNKVPSINRDQRFASTVGDIGVESTMIQSKKLLNLAKASVNRVDSKIREGCPSASPALRNHRGISFTLQAYCERFSSLADHQSLKPLR